MFVTRRCEVCKLRIRMKGCGQSVMIQYPKGRTGPAAHHASSSTDRFRGPVIRHVLEYSEVGRIMIAYSSTSLRHILSRAVQGLSQLFV